MILKQLQDLIGGIYDVSITHDVYDFLVTDQNRLPAAARSRGPTDEQLIVAQSEDGASGEIGMSLYLDPQLLERLDRADPMQRLDDGNVADYWTALEGVSHFVYLAWNAGHDKPVSLLELEMQAEVDKYVVLASAVKDLDVRASATLRRRLFEEVSFADAEGSEAGERYRIANDVAHTFVRRLEHAFVARKRYPEMRDALRRFYRLGQEEKLRLARAA